MKLVAISQRIDMVEQRDERRDAVDQRLIQWVQQAGYLPVPVPNTLTTLINDDITMLDCWLNEVFPHAVLLTGGNNIGQDALDRDATERYLLAWAFKHKKPLLGLCRGMQMLGNWSGSSLKKVYGHIQQSHTLQGSISGIVNSYHEFSIAACPTGFEILAQAEDGEIEAIGHSNLPWEGWMWHPEREEKFSEQDLWRFKKLLG